MSTLSPLIDGARAGRPRDIARLISLVENGSESIPEIMRELAADAHVARVVGITGSPGVGKSTMTSAIISRVRENGKRVGVLAVDPSSPFSGGALLGDRIRMQQHATDEGVFIRSMASRGHLGGLSATTPQALRVLDAAGFDIVLIETVGVGQSEIEVAGSADTTLVLVAPGMGDGIQAAKAGILEVGDVLVVNKADRDGAAATVRELRAMVALGDRSGQTWVPPVVTTVASTGEGIDDLIEAMDAHRDWLVDSGELDVRRVSRARSEIQAIAIATLRRRMATGEARVQFDSGAVEVAAGRLDAHTAAASLLAELR